MQNLDNIPQWKIKLNQNSVIGNNSNNPSSLSENTVRKANGSLWIPIILGGILAIAIYASNQKQKDNGKK